MPYVDRSSIRRPDASPWPFVGIGAIVCLGFVYCASILFLPWWGVALLMLVWLLLMRQGARWFTPRPRGTLLLALAGALVWLIAVALAAFAS